MRAKPELILLTVLFLTFLPWSATFGEDPILIVVHKSKRELELVRGSRIQSSYSIALGSKPVGAKQCRGDHKTPEGEYLISARNAKSAYYKSLRVSYPNRKDVEEAKTLGCAPGGDIMIHGLPNGRGWLGAVHTAHDWTDGCIAVTNNEMDELWKIIPVGTRVLIEP